MIMDGSRKNFLTTKFQEYRPKNSGKTNIIGSSAEDKREWVPEPIEG
jgi:hypothetical protein